MISMRVVRWPVRSRKVAVPRPGQAPGQGRPTVSATVTVSTVTW